MPTLEQIQVHLELTEQGRLGFAIAKKEIKLLVDYLMEGELPERVIQGFYDTRIGIVACTQTRLIFLDRGMIFGVNVEDFPLDKISSIQYETELLSAKITVFTSGNHKEIKSVNKDMGREFVDYVRNKTTKPSQVNKVSDDVISQLERLANLREKGVLTEDEFNQQKVIILGKQKTPPIT